jgi:hypothetical protein
MTYFPEQGQWVRWVTESFGREGEVIDSSWPSLTIKWLGVEEPQVFPWAMSYFEGSSKGMALIPAPKKMPENRQSLEQGSLSIAQAAVTLGITQKAVRSKLRAGKLRGYQLEGKWVGCISNG